MIIQSQMPSLPMPTDIESAMDVLVAFAADLKNHNVVTGTLPTPEEIKVHEAIYIVAKKYLGA